MKQLLQDNGFELNDDGSIQYHEEWKFLPNGKLSQNNEPSVSVHSFLKLMSK